MKLKFSFNLRLKKRKFFHSNHQQINYQRMLQQQSGYQIAGNTIGLSHFSGVNVNTGPSDNGEPSPQTLAGAQPQVQSISHVRSQTGSHSQSHFQSNSQSQSHSHSQSDKSSKTSPQKGHKDSSSSELDIMKSFEIQNKRNSTERVEIKHQNNDQTELTERKEMILSKIDTTGASVPRTKVTVTTVTPTENESENENENEKKNWSENISGMKNLPLTLDSLPVMSQLMSAQSESPPPHTRPQLAPSPSTITHFERTTLEFVNNVDDDCTMQWLQGFSSFIRQLSEKAMIKLITTVMKSKFKKRSMDLASETGAVGDDDDETSPMYQDVSLVFSYSKFS